MQVVAQLKILHLPPYTIFIHRNKYNPMKIKTISTLSSILLLSLSLLCITSCSEDKSEPLPPIALDVEGNSITLKYPNASGYTIAITGGDGNFTASCSDPSVFDVEVFKNWGGINLTAKSLGATTITITDQSNNSYTLNATAAYAETQFTIGKQDVVVTGDKLTPAQKKEIEGKAMLTLPVKEGGKFVLIHNNEEDDNKGQAFIYNDKNDEKGIETTFEIKEVEESESLSNYRTYNFIIDGKPREFIIVEYVSPTRLNVDMRTMSLNELLTNQFKADYPAVEFVYTQQQLQR